MKKAKCWKWVNVNEPDKEPEMQLCGIIARESWWGDEVTPQMFKDDLYQYGGGGPITVRIDSDGGDVVAASVMRSILNEYPGTVTMQIDGIAASAASVVTLAGDKVRMIDTAYMMIHDPMVGILGYYNAGELTKLAGYLDVIKQGIMAAYISRTGKDEQTIADWMTAETWFTAAKAVELGFADEIIHVGKVVNMALDQDIVRRYKSVPQNLILLDQQHKTASIKAQKFRNELKIIMGV